MLSIIATKFLQVANLLRFSRYLISGTFSQISGGFVEASLWFILFSQLSRR